MSPCKQRTEWLREEIVLADLPKRMNELYADGWEPISEDPDELDVDEALKPRTFVIVATRVVCACPNSKRRGA